MSNKLEVNSFYTEFDQFPALMTEDELIRFLRIPEVSKAKNPHNVVENLRRMHDLPCLHISYQPLYPRYSIIEWIGKKVDIEMN